MNITKSYSYLFIYKSFLILLHTVKLSIKATLGTETYWYLVDCHIQVILESWGICPGLCIEVVFKVGMTEHVIQFNSLHIKKKYIY